MFGGGVPLSTTNPYSVEIGAGVAVVRGGVVMVLVGVRDGVDVMVAVLGGVVVGE